MSGRVLGVDYGRRRVGLALSDPLGTIAMRLDHMEVRQFNETAKKVADTARAHGVETLVLGNPLHMNGSVGELAQEVARLAEDLRKRLPTCRILLWDERLTSQQAERVLLEADTRRAKRRQVIDSMAAQILLQSWLDAQPPA